MLLIAGLLIGFVITALIVFKICALSTWDIECKHKWEAYSHNKWFIQLEQQCSECGDFRHHTKLEEYDKGIWHEGRLEEIL